MNNVILMGRLARDPEVMYTTADNPMAVARLTMAVDRQKKDAGADFISCIAFGKTAEFFEKFAKKGSKFCVSGRIQTGSYEKEGKKVYTTDVVIDRAEFCESKGTGQSEQKPTPASDFVNVPDTIEEEMPFN